MFFYDGFECCDKFIRCHEALDMPDALKKLILGHSKNMDSDGTYGHEIEGDLDRAAEMMDEPLNRIIG